MLTNMSRMENFALCALKVVQDCHWEMEALTVFLQVHGPRGAEVSGGAGL